MQNIRFIAKPLRVKPQGSSEDVNTYEVRYKPTRNGLKATSGGDFSNLLLEAVCELPKANPHKERVIVSLEGNFPEKYVDETRKVFDFYSKAEGVDVDVL